VITLDPYAQDGVDVAEGDRISALAGEICRQSFHNSRFVVVDDHSGHFRGPRTFRIVGIQDPSIGMTSDGVGTKSVVIDAALAHIGAAHDLVAMCCGDITRDGGCPFGLNDDLMVRSIGHEGDPVNLTIRHMLTELGHVARESGVVIFRGETAEMGPCVGTDNPNPHAPFLWSGTALGIYLPHLMITGKDTTAGDQIIAIREHGFRANGLRTVAAAFQRKFGPDWFHHPDAQEHILHAATPSVLHERFLTWINGWNPHRSNPLIQVRDLVHVTGGGIRGKLGDALRPKGLSADLDDLYDPPEIMWLCREWRGMTDRDLYQTWNGGQGLLAIVSPTDSSAFLLAAEESGLEARVCGMVTRRAEPTIRIPSKYGDETVEYDILT